MYKAPIEILHAKRAEYKLNTETMVMEAVFETGINVDKDELIRALQYDREQYDKGFADGKAEAAEEIKVLEGELVVWKQDRFNIFQTTECYQRAQEKVAREIFEEIGKILYKHTNIAIKEKSTNCELAIDYIGEDIAELKKKYTEEKT